MAVVYESSTSFTEGNGTSIATMSKPPSSAIGNAILVPLYIEGGVTPVITSTGDTWTLVNEVVNVATTPDLWLHLWISIIANATSTIGITWGGGSFWRDAAAHRFSGVDQTTPLDVASTTNSGNSASEVGLGLAAGSAGRHLVLVTGNFNGNARSAWTAPLTERNDSGNVAMASGDDAAGNDTANKSNTIVSENWATIMLALRSADGGEPPPVMARLLQRTLRGAGI